MKPVNITLKTCIRYYHEKDPIFGKNGNCKCHGKGVKNFKIDPNNLSRKKFLNLIKGRDPSTGNQLVKINKGRDNRVCIDIPFSAPKSVSIMGLIAEDKDIIKAHKNAVKHTLKYIEKNYIYTRKTKNKITTAEKNDNAFFITFDHSASRDNDVHLHTHSLIINMVKSKDKFKALYNDKIFRDQTFLTEVYRSFLKEGIERLGYKTINKSNNWEIAGIEEKYIKKFSKRSEAIKDKQTKLKADDVNIKYNKLYKKSYYGTRKNKDYSLTKEDLKNIWNKQIDIGLLKKSVNKAKTIYQSKNTSNMKLKDRLNLVSKILEENEACFKKTHIINTIMKTFNINVLKAEKLFLKSLKHNKIINIKNENKKIPIKWYSTPKMIKAEQNILKFFKKGKRKIKIKLDKKEVDKKLDKDFGWVTKDQKKTVEHILFSEDKFSIIQGDAGTGKTASIIAVKSMIENLTEKVKNSEKDDLILGMGFTGKSAVELSDAANIESSTIQSFLSSEISKTSSNKSEINPLWIVDESSMVGSLDMEKILEKALVENAKVVFIGDGKQLKAISAGNMFSELQKIETIQTIKMNKVLRQKNKHMRKTVSLIKNHLLEKNKEDPKNKHLDKAFNILRENNSIIENNSYSDLTDQMCSDYTKNLDNNDTIILCTDNETKEEINLKIREKLQKDKIIVDKDNDYICRDPISLSGYKKYFSEHYKIGSKAFVYYDNGKSIHNLTLVDTNIKKNELVFKTIDNKKITINPLNQVKDNFKISLSKEIERKFAKGDKIIFQKNDKLLGLQNGLTGTIKKISNGVLKIKTSNKTLNISSKSYPYINYGYALTVHKSQGQTCDKVFHISKSDNISNAQSLYVSATRAKHDICLYTTNAQQTKESFRWKQKKTTTLVKEKENSLSINLR